MSIWYEHTGLKEYVHIRFVPDLLRDYCIDYGLIRNIILPKETFNLSSRNDNKTLIEGPMK